ncbi:MAG: hypothetical protein SF187_20165 [Deltaproteobacteria bacterium]|nr:hypothetical protein [Deltaproteobacteria bacterium]
MKNWKLLSMLGMFATIGGFVACSDDGEDAVALCNKTCDKVVACTPEAKPFLATCKDACKEPAKGNGTCTNESAIVSKVKTCLSESCTTFQTCLEQVPECVGAGTGGTSGSGGSTGAGGSTGSGGTLGSGGSTGTGGTSGSADCSVCAKADTCCAALRTQGGDPGDCDFKTSCDEQKNNPQGLSAIVQACNLLLSTGSSAGVQACK